MSVGELFCLLEQLDIADNFARLSRFAGIESVFPKEAYYSWYEQPTAAALYSAHSRVADRLLISTGYNASKEFAQQMVTNNNSLESNALGVYSPPETPTLFTPAFAAPDMTVYRPLPKPPALSPSSTESVMTSSRDVAQRRLVHLVTGLDTPDSYPSTASPRTPMDAGVGPYDGLICFSQGCAVSTGLLLRLGAKFGYNGALPVRFVILICGGRPFDSKGTMERVEAADVAPIEISSIHIQGRKDPGLEESKRLASLYSESGKQVIELDIGHCPPRRTSDVCTVASAIRKAIAQLA